MSSLNEMYEYHCKTPSDIYEHLPVLYKYSKECSVIAECGVRSVVSSWAFAKGLKDSGNSNTKLIGIDLYYDQNLNAFKNIVKANGINYYFILGNDIMVDIPKVDILFIDTWHVYAHLKRELEKHYNSVNKYIILHDTTVDGEYGETIRAGWNAAQQAIDSGYEESEICKGLWYAVEEFLIAHPEFVLKERLTNNNGLTILQRIS